MGAKLLGLLVGAAAPSPAGLRACAMVHPSVHFSFLLGAGSLFSSSLCVNSSGNSYSVFSFSFPRSTYSFWSPLSRIHLDQEM